MQLTLEIVNGEALGLNRRKIIGTEGAMIGRATTNDWVIQDQYIARVNARISFVNGAFYVEGLGRNPLAMHEASNTVPNHEVQLLRTGDRFFLDQYEICATISATEHVIDLDPISELKQETPKPPPTTAANESAEARFDALFGRFLQSFGHPDLDTSTALADAAIALATEHCWFHHATRVQAMLGAALLGAGRHQDAIERYLRIEHLHAAAADQPGTPWLEHCRELTLSARMGRGSAMIACAQWTAAAALYLDTAPLAASCEQPLLQLECYRLAGFCYEHCGKDDEAWAAVLLALSFSRAMPPALRKTLPLLVEALSRLIARESRRTHNQEIEEPETLERDGPSESRPPLERALATVGCAISRLSTSSSDDAKRDSMDEVAYTVFDLGILIGSPFPPPTAMGTLLVQGTTLAGQSLSFDHFGARLERRLQAVLKSKAGYEAVCRDRSALEFMRAFYADTPFDAALDASKLADLDAWIRAIANEHGFAEGEIPSGIPPSHWWWANRTAAAKIRFLSAHDFTMVAGRTSSETLACTDAVTVPVPQKVGGDIVVLVMYFMANHRAPASSPHYALRMEPATGKVLRFWPATPAELGILDPSAVVPGVDIPSGMSGLEFAGKRDRLLDLSRPVWSAFANGCPANEESVRPEVHEYWQLFRQITRRDVAPFYLQACPEFFAWVRSAL